jgi:long-chain fatty acid transport protein
VYKRQSLGLAYKVNNKLSVQGEMNFVGWESYKSLDFTYATTTTTLTNTTSARNWENVFIFRLGAHYQYNDKLELMAGIARDPSPVKDGYFSAETPDANRFLGTAGLVYKVSDKLNIMASYYFTRTDQRDIYNNADAVKGKIQTAAVAGGIGVSYKF